jgi:hypothetical protein
VIPRGEFIREKNWRVINRHIPEKLARRLKTYHRPNIRVAMAFARTILRDLGVKVA